MTGLALLTAGFVRFEVDNMLRYNSPLGIVRLKKLLKVCSVPL